MTSPLTLRFALAVLGCAAAGQTYAQYNMRTVPNVPAGGQPFLVVFDDDSCEDFFPTAPGLPPTFTVNGNQVSLAVDRLEVPDCSSAPVTFSVPVPGLPPGDYSLLLIGRALQSPNNYGELQTVPLIVAPAVGAARTTIPTNSRPVLILLVSLVGMIAAWRAWRQQA